MVEKQDRIGRENAAKREEQAVRESALDKAGITEQGVKDHYDSMTHWYNKPIDELKNEMFGDQGQSIGYRMGGFR